LRTAYIEGVTGERGRTRDLVHERVRRIAQATPSRIAVTDPARSFSYGELEARSNGLAHHLRTLGVGPGTRVGVCRDRSATNVVGLLATLKAGAAYIGMDPTFPEARLEYMLRAASAPVLLTDASTIERLRSIDATLIDLDVDPTVETEIDVAAAPVTASDAAYVMYTSGSSGRPKGVEISHGSLLHLVDWHNEAFGVAADDRASVLANPAFDASVWEVWPYLSVGANLHVPDPDVVLTPERLRDWLVTAGIAVSFVPTPLAEGLLELPWPERVTLRYVLTGGDVLHRRPAAGTPFTVVNNYGVAEATVVSTSGVVACGDTDDVPRIGRAIGGTHLYVLDPDGRSIDADGPGELYIGGAGVAVGYVDDPELTAERFLPDPFQPDPDARMYRTGDLVRPTPDGEYQFLGRLDSQVQVRGQRVELDEIAIVIESHWSVGRCVVISHDADSGNHLLIAYVVAAGDHQPEHEELRHHAATQLPSYMVPNAFVGLEALPLTANGKIDRRALPSFVAVAHTADVAGTSVERSVLSILTELLGVGGLGLHDNFFEFGGHSLMVAQLLAQVEDHFGVELPMLTVFDNPSAAGIAAAIEQDVASQSSVSS
jgi:amino acid adenylation domain-containing protein